MISQTSINLTVRLEAVPLFTSLGEEIRVRLSDCTILSVPFEVDNDFHQFRTIIFCLNKNQNRLLFTVWSDTINYFESKNLEMPGIDPGTSRMLSERSTI